MMQVASAQARCSRPERIRLSTVTGRPASTNGNQGAPSLCDDVRSNAFPSYGAGAGILASELQV
jgi:hypothetical protein